MAAVLRGAPAARDGTVLHFLKYRGFGIASGAVAIAFIFFFVYPLTRMLYAAFFKNGVFSTVHSRRRSRILISPRCWSTP
jgi:hypothetical protein